MVLARGIQGVPRTLEFRTEPLPLSGTSKILKRQLREEVLKRGG